MFEYTFRLKFADGQVMDMKVMANAYKTAWIGISIEMNERLGDMPMSVEWTKLT